jgi:hypothetical protein
VIFYQNMPNLHNRYISAERKISQKNPEYMLNYSFPCSWQNDGLPEISKMKNRNRIQEPGTTISSFADSNKKNINADRPTLDFFDMWQ